MGPRRLDIRGCGRTPRPHGGRVAARGTLFRHGGGELSTSVGIWLVGEGGPIRVSKSNVDLEKDLEGWIASDPSLLAEGLRIVGRQVWLEAGPVDLLGIDAQGRWVVVELKRERLYRETVAQALDYAACLRSIDAQELLDKLTGRLGDFGDRDELTGLVSDQLQDDGEREIAVTLVGTGVDPGLERVVGYLGRYDLPVSVVTLASVVEANQFDEVELRTNREASE